MICIVKSEGSICRSGVAVLSLQEADGRSMHTPKWGNLFIPAESLSEAHCSSSVQPICDFHLKCLKDIKLFNLRSLLTVASKSQLLILAQRHTEARNLGAG